MLYYEWSSFRTHLTVENSKSTSPFLMSTWFMDDPLESVTITSAGLTNENLYKLMNMKHLTNLHLGKYFIKIAAQTELISL